MQHRLPAWRSGPVRAGTIRTSRTNAGLKSVGHVEVRLRLLRHSAAGAGRHRALATAIITRGLSGAIYIDGYTDNLGSPAHGIQLSGDRAHAVAELLEDRLRGEPVKLVIAGYGEEDPIADNSTPQGETLNRRVMVLYKPNA